MQNIPEDAAWKELQDTTNNLFHSCTFCFLNEQNSECSNFKVSPNNKFFGTRRNIRFVSYFIFSSPDMLSEKRQNIPQDAAWKVLQFTLKDLFYICTFCFQNEQNYVRLIFHAANRMHQKVIFFKTLKLEHSEFCSFRKQKVQLWNKLFVVSCSYFHAASSGIFCIFNRMY